MVLTKEVQVKITKNKVYYYKRQGYDCNEGDIINVKVEHLSSSEKSKIQYKCDMCGEIIEANFSAFIKRHKLNENHYCVKCANIIKNKNRGAKFASHDGLKICKQCNRQLPSDNNHFYLKKDTKDGFTNNCRECMGGKFLITPKDGYKFCIKCDKELEINSKYFPKDDTCKDGFRNVCRECNGNYYREEETIKSEKWTSEDLCLLKSIYKDYTNEELVNKFFPNRTCHALDTQADQGGFAFKTDETLKRSHRQQALKTSQKMTGRKLTLEHCLKISQRQKEFYKTHHGWRLGMKASDETRRKLSEAMYLRGNWRGNKNPRHLFPLNGELNGNWQGGITGFYFELRSETKDWQRESMKFCNYHCVLTGGNFDKCATHTRDFSRGLVAQIAYICY